MAHETVFALVVDNVITLFPLTIDDINARNNPMEDYYYCYHNGEPTITNSVAQYIKEVPKLIGNSVYIDQYLTLRTYEEVADIIGLGPTCTKTIVDVTPEELQAVVIVVKERIQLSLDNFARERGYDDIKSVCTYINSQIPSYQQEAARAIYLRDLAWSNLYAYLNGVMTGATPLPVSYADIEVNLPALTWT